MVTCLPIDNVILVSGEKESIPLQASGCQGRQIFDRAEDRRERLMICDERETSTVQIRVKHFEAPQMYNTKGFLVNLAVHCAKYSDTIQRNIREIPGLWPISLTGRGKKRPF